MKLHTLLIVLVATLIGCSNNPAGPSGNQNTTFTSGEFGYVLNGESVDRNSYPIGSTASAILESNSGFGVPLNSKFLFITLMYSQVSILQYNSMTVGIGIPILAPVPNTYPISSSSDPTSATAFVEPDTLEYDSQPGGSVTITKFDTVNNLVSGTFYFTSSLTTDPSKTDKITSGFFNDVGIYVGSYGQGTLTANADGFPLSTSTSTNKSFTGFVVAGSTTLNILAVTDDNQVQRQLQMTIAAPKLGDFTLNDGQAINSAVASYSTSGAASDVSISTQSGGQGQLTITKYDMATHRLSATFSFSGTDASGRVVQVTTGVIDNMQWFNL